MPVAIRAKTSCRHMPSIYRVSTLPRANFNGAPPMVLSAVPRGAGSQCCCASLGPGGDAHVEHYAADRGLTPAWIMCSRLRALLRYLRVKGVLAKDLSNALPSVYRPAEAGLTSFMPNRGAQHALSCCVQETHVYRRNCAILMLLARSGLACGRASAIVPRRCAKGSAGTGNSACEATRTLRFPGCRRACPNLRVKGGGACHRHVTSSGGSRA